jgi:hypothetical protein
MGGIFRKPTRALIAESGPEAVIPLEGAGAAATGIGSVNITVNVAGSANDPGAIASAVERVIREHWEILSNVGYEKQAHPGLIVGSKWGLVGGGKRWVWVRTLRYGQEASRG